MQNKISLIILIIFSLIAIKAHGSDQMSFDVTEIEIIDGGNKIIGKNRGTITTDNGITIEANQFEFDKIKNKNKNSLYNGDFKNGLYHGYGQEYNDDNKVIYFGLLWDIYCFTITKRMKVIAYLTEPASYTIDLVKNVHLNSYS